MKAFLILEDGTVLTGESFGAAREVISEVVFNTSMTGYLEILTDPSYAGQSVVMTYPLIGNYGICMEDMESIHPWPKALIVRECAKLASNFRNEMTLDEFLKKYDVPGISGIDTRHLTRILREYGVMNGMITTREDFDLDEVVTQLKEYKVQGVVREVSCKEKRVLPGDGFKVALMDFGAKKNIEKSLNKRGCEVTVYPAYTKAEEIIAANPDGIMLSNGLYAEIVCFHYVGCIGNADGECSPCLDVLYGLVCLGEVQNNGVPLLHGAPCGVHDIVADLRQAQDGHSLLLDMSHDIRTPMNAIIGYAELASGHLPPIRYSLRQGQSLLL